MFCGSTVWAGSLDKFEEGANNGKSTTNYDDDDDNDCGVLCLIFQALLSGDDNSESSPSYSPTHEREYNPPPTREEASSSTKSTSRDGWEVALRSGYGMWGKDFAGRTFGVTFTDNIFQLESDGTWDLENVGLASPDSMSIRRVRAGVCIGGPQWWVSGLAGFSMLQGNDINGYFSTHLGLEYRRKYAGLEWTWDMDAGGDGHGFHDLYWGAYVQKGPVKLDAGYRVRATMQDDPYYINGPQVGVTIRFGRWRYQ